MTGPSPLDRQIQLAASAVDRVIGTAGAGVLGSGNASPWETVYSAVLLQRDSGEIPFEAAAAELKAVRTIATLADTGALADRLESSLFSRPQAKQVLSSAMRQTGTAVGARLEALEREAGPRPSAPAGAPARPDPGRTVHEPISEEDLSALTRHVMGGWDPLDVIFHDRVEQLTNVACGVLAEASWATGVRPAEWLGANLVVERDGMLANVHEVYCAVLAADPPPEQSASRPRFLAHARHLLTGILDSGQVWLKVTNAKNVWLKRHGLSETRSIGLSRCPSHLKLSVFCATALVRRVGPDAWLRWRKRINRRLRAAAALALPRRLQALTLYGFRHDFIDRCKAILGPAEVMALAGHSSVRSKVHYGRPRVRGGSGGRDPPAEAEPSEVRAMERHLERVAVVRKDPSPAAPDSALSPSPSFSGGSP